MFNHFTQGIYDFLIPFQDASAAQFFDIMGNAFDTKDTFAFAVYLGGELTEMNFEHRKIPGRSLDFGLQSGGLAVSVSVIGTAFISKNGPDRLYVKRGTCMVNDAVKDLFHLATASKEKVATVLGLIYGKTITETTTLLFVRRQGKTQTTRINPTLADLRQTPYNAGSVHGICDTGKSCGVGKTGKAIVVLAKVNAFLRALTGDILMTIEYYLRKKRRMRTETNDNMPPLSVHNMEGIVVGVTKAFLLPNVNLAITKSYDFAQRGRRFAYYDSKKARSLWRVWKQRRTDFFLALLATAVNQWDSLLGTKCMNSSGKMARKTHKMRIIQFLLCTKKPLPPDPESATAASHRKIGIKHDTINAIIGLIKKFPITPSQIISNIHISAPDYEYATKNDEIVYLIAAPKAPLLPGEVPDEA